MANIRERNGSYQISVFIGKDKEGRNIMKRTTFVPTEKTPKKIEKEVQAFARDFEDRVKNGEYRSGEEMTFEEFVERWDSEWASHPDNLTQTALENYRDILRRVFVPELGFMVLAKVKAEHIQNIYNKMYQNGKASKTIKKAHTAVNSVMRYAYRMEVIKENPCDRCVLPKVKKNQDIHYFTLEQAQRFLDAFDKEYPVDFKGRKRKNAEGEVYDVKSYVIMKKLPTQYKVYFTLAIYGGFRRGEIIGLNWADINFEEETVSINKAVAKTKSGQIIKDTKTVSGNRTIKLPSSCFALLKEWRTEQKQLSLELGTKWVGHRGKDFDKNPVFIQLENGDRMCVDTPSHKFKRILEIINTGIEDEEDKLPNIHLHDLRHTSATLLLANNVDIETVSHRMGHSETSITLDVYGHWMEETDIKASNTLDRLFSKQA